MVSKKVKWSAGILTGLLMVVSLFLMVGRKAPLRLDINGVRVIDPPVPVSEFKLKSHDGASFTEESLKGGWNLLTIGFVYCPDICPTTLSDMAAAFRKLEKEPGGTNGVRLVFISVDPYRDSLELLGQYVGYFYPDFLGVTGVPERVKQMVNSLDLNYVYADPEDNSFIKDVLKKPDFDDYVVVHSTPVLFINPKGELVARMSPPFITDRVVATLQKLRNYYGE